MIIAFGTVALDTTRTPFKTAENVLGGSASYCALSAKFFYKTGIVSAVGKDFPEKYRILLHKNMDTAGLSILDGKTFRYDSTFDYDLSKRTSNSTELNVVENFRPELPEEYRKAGFVYLGNNDPRQNIDILKQFDKPKLTACDTIEFWIRNRKDDVVKMIENVDCVILNDDEARMILSTSVLVKCGKKLLEMGPKFAIIKKGEHGSLFFTEDIVYPVPGYPLEEITDPTGAGDSFAGGFIGHLARTGKTNLKSLKDAVVYGNVMGSFAVEDFGVNKLTSISIGDIEKRFKDYKEILNF